MMKFSHCFHPKYHFVYCFSYTPHTCKLLSTYKISTLWWYPLLFKEYKCCFWQQKNSNKKFNVLKENNNQILTQVNIELTLGWIVRSRKFEFDFLEEQFFVKLYLPHIWTPNY
jgi:hypothetical protein